MEKVLITKNKTQTKKLGEMLAKEILGGQIICLSGELGAGKTTFTQGLLKGLGARGPYTSPTFVIMKEYKTKKRNIYHMDAYRIGAEDMQILGWEEIAQNGENIAIVEWADRVYDIIPKESLWVHFEGLNEKERKITFSNKNKT